MRDEESRAKVNDKLWNIAYKRKLLNKDNTIYYLLRENYITIGSKDVYILNRVISILTTLFIPDEELTDIILKIWRKA